jgi:ribonuclease III
VSTLEAELRYEFQDRALLARALTHRSRAFEQNPREQFADNEQLEFLGDSILGFLASERLVQQFPHSPEGDLSKLKAHLVSAAHLYEVAREIGLGEHLLLGRGEEMSGGREKKAILANALEALIAALYLDGGIEPVRAFIVNRIMTEHEPTQSKNYKSDLQELARANKLPLPEYRCIEEHGPDQAKTFVIEVQMGGQSSRAEGPSKKSAGQNAARALLERVSSTDPPRHNALPSHGR